MDNRSETQAALSTRERLNQIRRTTFIVVLVGTALFLAGAGWWMVTSATLRFAAGAMVIPLPMKVTEGGAAMMIAGAALVACAVMARALAGRCNACQRRLSRPFSCGSGPMRISRSFHVCPYCAASIDEVSGGAATVSLPGKGARTD